MDWGSLSFLAKITEQMIARFGERMNGMLRNRDNVFRTAYVRLFVDEVVVSPEKSALLAPRPHLNGRWSAPMTEPGGPVPIFDREWCPGEDSNLHALASAST